MLLASQGGGWLGPWPHPPGGISRFLWAPCRGSGCWPLTRPRPPGRGGLPRDERGGHQSCGGGRQPWLLHLRLLGRPCQGLPQKGRGAEAAAAETVTGEQTNPPGVARVGDSRGSPAQAASSPPTGQQRPGASRPPPGVRPPPATLASPQPGAGLEESKCVIMLGAPPARARASLARSVGDEDHTTLACPALSASGPSISPLACPLPLSTVHTRRPFSVVSGSGRHAGALAAPRGVEGGVCTGEGGRPPVRHPWVRSQGLGQLP